MMIALSVVILVIASFLPTADLALSAIAGLTGAVIVIRHGAVKAIPVFAATALLAFFVVPEKGVVLTYTILFGHYPITKYAIERLHSLVLEWIVKLLFANALFMLLFFLVSAFFPAFFDFAGTHWALILLLANATFVLYDIGFSRLITAFAGRISRL